MPMDFKVVHRHALQGSVAHPVEVDGGAMGERGYGACALAGRRNPSWGFIGMTSVDGFAVDLQPAAEGAEALLLDEGDGAVGSRAHVEGEAAAAGHELAEMLDELAVGEVVVEVFVAVEAEAWSL